MFCEVSDLFIEIFSIALIVLLTGFEDESPRHERNESILFVSLSYQDLKLDRMRPMISNEILKLS